jgi:spectinomycin phosphotransferase
MLATYHRPVAAPLPQAALVDALRSSYGIVASRLEQAERGKDFAASVHRVYVDAPAPRYIVKLRPAGAPRNVAAAVARHLADSGVPGVVAPVRSNTGSVSAVAGAHSLTVYPFIDGRLGIDMPMSDASWRALGRFARRLHGSVLPPDLAESVPRETYRPYTIETIAQIDAAATAMPPDAVDETTRPVLDLWRSERARILELADRTRALGDALRRRSLPLVTCHADMHTGNLIVNDAGVWVIDWDEVVLAPKERDLMFSVGGGISTDLVDTNATMRFLEGYGDVEIDQEALAYYRHAWAEQDVSGYAWRALLDPTATDAQRADAAAILIGLFRPGEIVDLAARSVAS